MYDKARVLSLLINNNYRPGLKNNNKFKKKKIYIYIYSILNKEGNYLITLNTFYLWLYGIW